uniref:Autophagy protein 5 n=1 Tax=Angiostrongylus cantonensis TaxID=6313 RepID=A0A0K0DQ20_ANGCA
MGRRLNAHMEWLDSAGYSPYVWLRGDWHQPLHLLSKLMADELNKRRPSNSTDDVTFKIGFNTSNEALPVFRLKPRIPLVPSEDSIGKFNHPAHDLNGSGRQSISSWLLMEDSTDSSYTFTDSDEAFCGESRNPFADSDDDCKTPTAHTVSGM